MFYQRTREQRHAWYQNDDTTSQHNIVTIDDTQTYSHDDGLNLAVNGDEIGSTDDLVTDDINTFDPVEHVYNEEVNEENNDHHMSGSYAYIRCSIITLPFMWCPGI